MPRDQFLTKTKRGARPLAHLLRVQPDDLQPLLGPFREPRQPGIVDRRHLLQDPPRLVELPSHLQPFDTLAMFHQPFDLALQRGILLDLPLLLDRVGRAVRLPGEHAVANPLRLVDSLRLLTLRRLQRGIVVHFELHRRRGRPSLGRPQHIVVLQPSLLDEQHQPRLRHLVEQLLRQLPLRTRCILSQERHLPVRCGLDHVRVGLVLLDPQQSVVMRRLFRGGNPQPFVIGD